MNIFFSINIILLKIFIFFLNVPLLKGILHVKLYHFFSLWNFCWLPYFTLWKHITLVLCSITLISHCSHSSTHLGFSFHIHCLIPWSSSSVVFVELMEKKNPWFSCDKYNNFDRIDLIFRSVFPWPKMWPFKTDLNCLHFRKKFTQEAVSVVEKEIAFGFCDICKVSFGSEEKCLLFHLFYFVLLETPIM